MKIALIHDAVFPVHAYGGTERVVWWLAKGLAERGLEVSLVCKPGSTCPYAPTLTIDFSRPAEVQLPQFDLFHYFVTPSYLPQASYLVTIGGNGKAGERFLPNTAFVSENHARRHGAECFVYNGIDPDDYLYRESKDPSLLFLAKASWKVKNVRGAIRIARRVGRPLDIVGGERTLFRRWRGTNWRGLLGGVPKARLIARASALLFPVLWDEPFGIAVIEAMVSGTPVLATPFGSLPELVAPQAGAICRSEEEFLSVLGNLSRFRAAECRAWAIENFSYRKMAANYHELYQRILNHQSINSRAPHARKAEGAMYSLPTRIA